MGNSSSIRDKRSSAQREVEQKMSMQLIIPKPKTYLNSTPLQEVELYTIGRFEGGEFCPIQPCFKVINDNNDNHNDDNHKIHNHREKVTKSLTTNSGETFTLFIEEEWIEKFITSNTLDELLLGKNVDKEQFGNGSEFYIVQGIYMSSNFIIDSIIDSNNYSIEHRHCKGIEQAPRTFGYRLKRYKINYKGEVCNSNDIVNKVF